MANEEHLAILRQGVEVWNKWRKENPDMRIDLTGANLSKVNLGWVNLVVDPDGKILTGAERRKAIFSDDFQGHRFSIEADLHNVIFRGADLREACLIGADLRGADLRETDLSGAKLMESSLIDANLSKANLRNAGLTHAKIQGTNFKGVDFSGVDFREVQISQDIVIGKKWRKVWKIANQRVGSRNLRGVDLSGANLSYVDLRGFDLSGADFSNTNLIGCDLREAIISQDTVIEKKWRKVWEIVNGKLVSLDFRGADLSGANLSQTNLSGFDFSDADLSNADLREANLSNAKLWRTDLKKTLINQDTIIEKKWRKVWEIVNGKLVSLDFRGADLSGANLTNASLNGFDFSNANLNGANLCKIQALGTNFTGAKLTGACLEDWHINSATNLNGVTCDYVYFREKEQERRPSSGNFAPGEFKKIFQKSLETVDLIFRNGIDWDAFAYSFKKVEVENSSAQLDVQSIEKKGDGVLLVRVAVTPDADKAKIHSEFMQGYEFAYKALEAQYQARIDDKDKIINQLFSTINQLSGTPKKVSNYYLNHSQIAGGIVDAETVQSQQIGGNIHNTDNQNR